MKNYCHDADSEKYLVLTVLRESIGNFSGSNVYIILPLVS